MANANEQPKPPLIDWRKWEKLASRFNTFVSASRNLLTVFVILTLVFAWLLRTNWDVVLMAIVFIPAVVIGRKLLDMKLPIFSRMTWTLAAVCILPMMAAIAISGAIYTTAFHPQADKIRVAMAILDWMLVAGVNFSLLAVALLTLMFELQRDSDSTWEKFADFQMKTSEFTRLNAENTGTLAKMVGVNSDHINALVHVVEDLQQRNSE